MEGGDPGDSGRLIPGYMCHPIDSGNVTPGAGSGRGHPGDCEHVTPGAWSERCCFPGDSGCGSRHRIWQVGSLGDCGHVTPNTVPGRGHPWD